MRKPDNVEKNNLKACDISITSRRKVAIQTDERVKIMNEVLAGMRVIKMYCWEKPFIELIKRIRM